MVVMGKNINLRVGGSRKMSQGATRESVFQAEAQLAQRSCGKSVPERSKESNECSRTGHEFWEILELKGTEPHWPRPHPYQRGLRHWARVS
jgi:hypothetical protein